MAASGEVCRTLVVGLGITGLSAARFLASRGETVRVIDSRSSPPGLAALRRDHPDVPVVLESLDARWLHGVSRLVLSPGIGPETPIVGQARELGIPVVGDIELFARAADAPVIGVTGSNGKSTVVTLVERLLSSAGLKVAAGGNLGPPALDLLGAEVDAYVLELSSFQLETTESLDPLAAAVLNVSPDHLDRHGDFRRYAASKARLARGAKTFVYNRDDETVREMARAHGQAIPFSVDEFLESGYSVTVREGERWLCRDGTPFLATSELRLRGRHNEANALAAVALTQAAAELGGIARCADVLREFSGLAHRCQWVAEDAGVVFVDDSKGTNVGATVAALQGLPGPFVLIAGGQGKGADFGPLAAAARDRVVGSVVMGEAGPALGRALSAVTRVREARDMREAVRRAVGLAGRSQARPITVLLSPACASLDMFADYRERGEAFVAAVKELLP